MNQRAWQHSESPWYWTQRVLHTLSGTLVYSTSGTGLLLGCSVLCWSRENLIHDKSQGKKEGGKVVRKKIPIMLLSSGGQSEPGLFSALSADGENTNTHISDIIQVLWTPSFSLGKDLLCFVLL